MSRAETVSKNGDAHTVRKHLGVNSVTKGRDTNCNKRIRVETVTKDGDTNCNQTSIGRTMHRSYYCCYACWYLHKLQ